jgi:hypothetical protein
MIQVILHAPLASEPDIYDFETADLAIRFLNIYSSIYRCEVATV